MNEGPIPFLWIGTSGWKLPQDFHRVAALQELTPEDIEWIERAGQEFHDARTRPSDKEVRKTCAPLAKRVQGIAREILGLPLDVRKVLWERYGAVQFHELVARLDAFADAATYTRPKGHPPEDARSILHLRIRGRGEEIRDIRGRSSFDVDAFVQLCIQAIDPAKPVPTVKTLDRFIKRVREARRRSGADTNTH